MDKSRLVVFVQWDDEANVYVATSDDIPGLITEAKSLDHLIERVVAVAPELLEDNAINGEEDFRSLLDICVRAELVRAGHPAY